MSNSLRAIQNARKLRQQSLRGGGYDPYEAQATEAVRKKRSKANPLQLILDLLQRGQYLTANMVDEAIEAVGENRGAKGILDVLKAGIWEGFITGKRKGSYSDIIEEQAGPDAKLNEPIFKKREGKFLGKLTGADTLGFLGDVFLDPTTYISFGSTKAASAIASRYADDVVRLVANSFGRVGDDATKAALKGLSSVSDDILKTAAKGFDGPVYKKLLGESTEKAQRYLRKHFDNFAKVQNDVYKEAYKKALNNPDKVLTKDMIERLGLSGLEGDKLAKQISKMPEGIKDVAEGLIAREGYPGAGERAMRFMGGELFKGVRKPWAGKVAWNKAEHIFRTSAAGRKLSDFFWAANNRGVIGAVRNALGIRNPYQKHLRMIELDQVQHAEQLFQNIGRRFAQVVGDDQTSRVVREVFEEAEWIDALTRVKAKGAGMPEVEISFRDLLKNPKVIDKIEKQLGPEGVQVVTKQATEIDNLLNELAYKENIWVREFFGGDMGDITNYIPTLYRDQRMASKVAQSQSFTKKRVYTRKESIDQQVAKFRSFFKNIPEKDARELIESGAGDFVTDLKGLMFSRIMAHAKMASKVNMIQKFREVGVPIKNITGKDELLEQAIKRSGGQYQQAGLVRLEHPALKEFLFDEDVAKIIDRSMEATGNLRGPIQSVFANYTQWWKGIVTMTPGFHLRNHYNNWLMGFLYYGPRWFRVNKWDVPSIAAVHRALKMRNPKTWFDGTGITDEVSSRVLNRRIGDYTIAELGDIATRYGVISQSLHGIDPLDLVGRATGRKMTTMNPFPSSKQFQGVELSRHAGNYIENVPRFKAFLMSYDDITKGNKGVLKKLQKEGILTKEGMDKTGWQIQAAALDAKKIFLDYTDLTDVERKVMKNIIPFYCVDTETEVLTVNGWRNHEELKEGDKLYTVNMETHCIEVQEATGVARFDYDGELIKMQNRNIDMLVTPNHRCITFKIHKRRTGQTIESCWREKEAKDLISSDWMPVATDGWRENRTKKYENDFVEMVGWIITEGTINDVYVSITQSLKNHFNRIVSCVERLGWKYSITSKGRETCPQIKILKPHSDVIRRFFDGKKQLRLDFINDLTYSQMKLLRDVMILGDGYQNYKDRVFIQKDKITAENFQILCTLTGQSTRHKTETNFTRGRYSKKPINWIRIKRIRNVSIRNVNPCRQYYKGIVWCPSTPNGTVFYRRNGIVYPGMQTWLRKNLAAQVNGIALYPGMYGLIPKLEDLVRYQDPQYDPDMVPEYMRQLGFFPITKKSRGLFGMFNPNIGLQDFARIPLTWEEGNFLPRMELGELRDDIMGAAHPLIKSVVEMIPQKGYDVWRKRELGERSAAPYTLRLFTKNPQTLVWLDGMLRLAGAKDGINLEIDKDGKLLMNAKIKKLIENNLPLVRQMDFMLMGGEVLMPELQDAIEEATGAKSDYDKLEKLLQVMSYYLGIKQSPMDVAEQREYYEEAISRERSRLKRDAGKDIVRFRK